VIPQYALIDVIGGTATNTSDYNLSSPDTVTIPPADYSGGNIITFSIPLINDNEAELDETILLELNNSISPLLNITGNTLTTTTITDIDTMFVSIRPINKGVENPLTNGNFEIYLSQPYWSDLEVTFDDLSSVATSGSDYQVLTTTQTISAGSTSLSLPIQVVDDNEVEQKESVILSLLNTNQPRVKVSPSNTTATIYIFSEDLKFSQMLSPNGDGFNDVFSIEGYELELYPSSKFSIFTRHGQIVYTESPFQNLWDANASKLIIGGTALTSGYYFFILDKGNGEKETTGYIRIVKE